MVSCARATRGLVFTWRMLPSPDSSRVRIDGVLLGTGSEVTVAHELYQDWADHASRTETAWTQDSRCANPHNKSLCTACIIA